MVWVSFIFTLDSKAAALHHYQLLITPPPPPDSHWNNKKLASEGGAKISLGETSVPFVTSLRADLKKKKRTLISHFVMSEAAQKKRNCLALTFAPQWPLAALMCDIFHTCSSPHAMIGAPTALRPVAMKSCSVMNCLLIPPPAGRPGPRQSDQDAERAGGAVHGRYGEARQTGGGAQDVHHERQRWAREEIMTNVLPLR